MAIATDLIHNETQLHRETFTRPTVTDKKTTSFMRSLCMGVIEENVILPFPQTDPTEAETLRDISGALDGPVSYTHLTLPTICSV